MVFSIGVVTARKLTIDYVKEELEFLNLNSFIRMLVTFNDIPFQEPTKVNLISECIKQLNVKVVNVGYRRLPEDILAGRKIGALTIGALYGFYGRKLIDCHPHFTIRKPLEILKILIHLVRLLFY